MRKKILIVDDEPDILMLLERRLSQEGYSVIKAQNAKEAIAAARKELPNLILLDIVMPGMDGAKAAEILRNDPLTKDIPVIFVTCLFTKEEEKKGHARAGRYFVAKPYDPEELLRIIAKNIRDTTF